MDYFQTFHMRRVAHYLREEGAATLGSASTVPALDTDTWLPGRMLANGGVSPAPHTDYLNGTGKRGARGGIRRRIWARGTKPPLPTIILTNVRSLRNQIDKLLAPAQYLTEYRDSCLLCFSETWLNTRGGSTNIFIGWQEGGRRLWGVAPRGKSVWAKNDKTKRCATSIHNQWTLKWICGL